MVDKSLVVIELREEGKILWNMLSSVGEYARARKRIEILIKEELIRYIVERKEIRPPMIWVIVLGVSQWFWCKTSEG